MARTILLAVFIGSLGVMVLGGGAALYLGGGAGPSEILSATTFH